MYVNINLEFAFFVEFPELFGRRTNDLKQAIITVKKKKSLPSA